MISIITPTYNRATLIHQTINSVLKQSLSDWEMIIVDDGSTDNTVESLQEYLRNDRRFKLVQKPNTGAAHCRNVGADQANGDWIVFLDSDDTVDEDWLKKARRVMSADVGIVCVGAVHIQDGKQIKVNLPKKIGFLHPYGTFRFTAGSFFMRRQLFLDAGGFDIELESNHHTDLGYRVVFEMVKQNLEPAAVDELLVNINVHEADRIRNNWSKIYNGTVRMLNKYDQFFQEIGRRKVYAVFHGVCAHAAHKMGDRKRAVQHQIQKIRYRRSSFRDYLKLVKYAIGKF